MALSQSPELSYCTRDNIVLPTTEPRTAVAIRDRALEHLADEGTVYGHGAGGRAYALALPADRPVLGEADDNLFTLTDHGFTTGDAVKLTSVAGGTGLTLGTIYYVIAAGLTANVFSVSATPGGSAVDVTADATVGTSFTRVSPQGGAPRAVGAPALLSLGTPDEEV